MFSQGNRAHTIHGLLLIVLFSCAAFYIAEQPLVKSLSLSPLIVGILLGMVYANTLRNHLPESWTPGVKFCTKQILRTGIVLYGFRLTLNDVAAVGLPAVMVDLVIVCSTLFLGVFVGKLLKMDGQTALMTATGSSICGAAAVLGAEGVVKCPSYKTAIAVSTVVIFGTIAMFLYPIMYRTGLLDALGDVGTAIYTGATLHEVAHVAGAGNAMDPTDSLGIAGVATITKMIRVMLLAPVLVIMALVIARARQDKAETLAERAEHMDQNTQEGKAAAEAAKNAAKRTHITIPYFAFGFIIIICINTLLQQMSGVDSVKEIPLNGTIEYIDTFLLTMAMTALGTDTSFDKFKAAGAKPFILAAILFVWLLVGGYFLSLYIPGLFI